MVESIFLSKSLLLYAKNFKAAIVFAILLVSVIFFASFQNMFVSSGTIFFSYYTETIDSSTILAQAIGIIAFLLFYSLFVTVIVFSVKRELSTVKLHYFLTEAVRKFSFKLFAFFLFFLAIAYLLQLFFLSIALPLWLSALILLILSIVFLFLPQAVVVDEQNVWNSIKNSLEFSVKYPLVSLFILVVGAVLVAVIQLIELGFDKDFFLGNYVSIFLVMIFVQPFLEVIKTYLYIVTKFELIKQHELKQA